MSNKYSPAEFHEINARLIEWQKTLKETQRIREQLGIIEHDLGEKRAALSLAVTDLKWKVYKLQKTKEFSIEAILQGILGKKKEWEENIRHAHFLSQTQYEECKNKLEILVQRQSELLKQLTALQDNLLAYEKIPEQQVDFLLTQKGENSSEILAISEKLDEILMEKQTVEAILDTGMRTLSSVQAFSEDLLSLLTKDYKNMGVSGILLLLPVELLAESVQSKSNEFVLNARINQLQIQIDLFQTHLSSISHQFWPPLCVQPPTSQGDEKLRWQYHLQQLETRLKKKCDLIQKLAATKQTKIDSLVKKKGQLIQNAWQALVSLE